MNYYVEIVARDGEKVEECMGPMSDSAAERVKAPELFERYTALLPGTVLSADLSANVVAPAHLIGLETKE